MRDRARTAAARAPPPHRCPSPTRPPPPPPIPTPLQQSLFINRKAKSLALQRKRAAKIAWTATYRKQHKKDAESAVARKKRRSATRVTARSIVGASLEVINKRRAEKPEARKASREAAVREVKERAKKARAEKAALRSSTAASKGAKPAKQAFAPAPAAKGGARGKR